MSNIKNHKEALDLCDEILELCEQITAEAGEEFKDSVTEKVESMQANIYDRKRCTDKQFVALTNMRNGADKWVNSTSRDEMYTDDPIHVGDFLDDIPF